MTSQTQEADMMSRKDYRTIAAAIRDAIERSDAHPSGVAESIARALEAESGFDANGNRRFDRDRFLREAGVR